MNYDFTYEVTTNCNYKCDYCVVCKDEKYSDINLQIGWKHNVQYKSN